MGCRDASSQVKSTRQKWLRRCFMNMAISQRLPDNKDQYQKSIRYYGLQSQ